MANILLVTHWTSGDVMPFIKLGESLNKQGHDVTIFTHCIYRDKAIGKGLNFEALDTMTEYQEMVRDFPLLSDPIGNLEGALNFQRKHHGHTRCLREVKLIQNHCRRKDTILLFRHRSSVSALLAAESMNKPATSVFLSPNYISHLAFHEELFGKVMKEEINRVRQTMGLEPIQCWTDWMCSTKRKIALWPQWYANQEDEALDGLVKAGFLVDEGQSQEVFSPELQAFLDRYSKPVIITGGTSRMINPRFYKVAVDGCMLLKQPAIVISPFEEFVPTYLPEYIRHFTYVPLRQLMPYACAIIHHGGINTACEAVACAIPQLILAHMADRPDNAQRLKQLGVAKSLPESLWTAEVLAHELSTLDTAERRTMCLRLSEIHHGENPVYRLNTILEEMLDNPSFVPSCHDIKPFMSVTQRENDTASPEALPSASLSKRKQLLMEILRSKAK